VKVPRNQRECSDRARSANICQTASLTRTSFLFLLRVFFARDVSVNVGHVSSFRLPLSFANSSAANLEHAASRMLREIIRSPRRSPLRLRVFFLSSRSGTPLPTVSEKDRFVDRVAKSHRIKAHRFIRFLPNYVQVFRPGGNSILSFPREICLCPIAINYETIGDE
jgi:hypothetical protein